LAALVRDDGHMTRTRRHKRRFAPARPLIAAAVLSIGLVIAMAFAGVTIQENALERTITGLNAEISSAEAYRAQLQASNAEKKTTDYVVEKAKQLGWVWPWEALISVQRDAEARALATPASERPSRVSRWITLFTHTR
jgi:hypothetical protein